MPHERLRHALAWVQKLASFWPVVGVIGLRQVGKSTLVRNQVQGITTSITMDEDTMRDSAQASSKAFLARLKEPVLIDEIQKVPKLFDAIKARVDREKKPGQYFLTGSTAFSSRLGIRESLTGRIGLLHLYPLTLSEIASKPYEPKRGIPIHSSKLRFGVEALSGKLNSGGLPVPAFIRDSSQSYLYFQSWIETTVYRDVARVYGENYDPELAMQILKDLAHIHWEGEIPTKGHFRVKSRLLPKYLSCFLDLFLIQTRICHEAGVGKHIYVFSDSGICAHLMGASKALEEGSTLSLVRITIANEINSVLAYQGKPAIMTYFKSHKGSPVDLVWEGIPVKFVASHKVTGWDKRAVEGAMKKLRSKRGIISAPIEVPEIQKTGISIVPWSYWS